MRNGGARLVVFDFDGTIVDSQHTIVGVMLAAFEAHDLAPPETAAVRRLVGLPLEQAVARLLPPSMAYATPEVVETYRQFFQEWLERPGGMPPLYDGMAALLAGLEAEGMLLGICTGRARRSLLPMLEALGLSRHFVTLQAGCQHPGKPHPAMLRAALAAAGADRGAALMIGDTVYDIDMARAAGVAALGVGWGYHPPAELAAAGVEVAADAAALAGGIAAWAARCAA